MNFSRGLAFAAAALASSMSLSIASSGATAAEGSGPGARSMLQLAQTTHQPATSPAAQPTQRPTGEQRSEIKSALEKVASETQKQVAVEVVTSVEQLIYGVAVTGTPQQKDALAAAVHREFRLWRKQHAANHRNLEALMVKLAALGVPVDEVIVPAIQQAEERAAARSAARPATVLSEDQKAKIDAALENISPQEVKGVAAGFVTIVMQLTYEAASGESISGGPVSQQQREQAAVAVHQVYRAWRERHAAKVDRRDLDELVIKLAALGVPVDQVIMPAIQQAKERAATVSRATALSEEQKAKIDSALKSISPQELKQAAVDIVTVIDQLTHEAVTGESIYGVPESPQQRAELAAAVHRTLKNWQKIHAAKADNRDLEQLLIKLAALGVPVDSVIIPAVQHVREAAATRSGSAPAIAVSDDQKARIEAEVQKLSPTDVKLAAEKIGSFIVQVTEHRESSVSTPEQQALLDAEIRRTIQSWQAKHAERTDRDDLAQLLIKLATLGVAVDAVIIPAVQHVREVAAARPASPPTAAADHPAEPVIIVRHR